MHTKQDFSLIPDSGRIVPPIVNAPGNWEFIVQYFQFWEDVAGTLQLANIVPASFDDTLYFFFFGHDRPLISTARSYYADATLTDTNNDTLVLPEPTYHEEVFPQSDPSVLAGVVTANETDLSIGQYMTGVTATAGVVVEGYPMLVDLKNRGLVDAEAAALTCVVKGEVICSGDILHGQPFAQGMEGVNTQVPVILSEPAYTQAIRDAGNRVTQGTVDLVIVGLWAGNDQ